MPHNSEILELEQVNDGQINTNFYATQLARINPEYTNEAKTLIENDYAFKALIDASYISRKLIINYKQYFYNLSLQINNFNTELEISKRYYFADILKEHLKTYHVLEKDFINFTFFIIQFYDSIIKSYKLIQQCEKGNTYFNPSLQTFLKNRKIGINFFYLFMYLAYKNIKEYNDTYNVDYVNKNNITRLLYNYFHEIKGLAKNDGNIVYHNTIEIFVNEFRKYLKENNITELQENINRKNKKLEQQVHPFFLELDCTWDDIQLNIHYTRQGDARIEFVVDKKKSGKLKISDLGFIDDRTKRTNKNWACLQDIVAGKWNYMKGIAKSDESFSNTIDKRLSELNKHLKKITGIDDKFYTRKQKQFPRPKFHIELINGI